MKVKRNLFIIVSLVLIISSVVVAYASVNTYTHTFKDNYNRTYSASLSIDKGLFKKSATAILTKNFTDNSTVITVNLRCYDNFTIVDSVSNHSYYNSVNGSLSDNWNSYRYEANYISTAGLNAIIAKSE